MDDVRNEAASSMTPSWVDCARDEAGSSATSYEKGRKIFERMKESKRNNNRGRGSFVATMFQGSVRDRKKFFEHRISEQKQKEHTPVKITPFPKTSLATAEGSAFPVDERTDSESFSRNINNRTDPESLSSSSENNLVQYFDSDSDSDSDPSEILKLESSYYATKELGALSRNAMRANELHSSGPGVGVTGSSSSIHSRGYIEKVESLDMKIVSKFLANSASRESNETEKDEEPGRDHRQGSETDGGGGSTSDLKENASAADEVDSLPNVKIQVTSTIIKPEEDEYIDSSDEAISKLQLSQTEVQAKNKRADRKKERKIDIDKMITEFQQATAELSEQLMLSEKLMANASPSNLLTNDPSSDQGNTDDDNSYDLTMNDFKELAEKLETQKSVNSNYNFPSESIDGSIDSRGNSKTTKSIASKSVKSNKSSRSAKSLIKMKKVKNVGVGKMLKKAKKGMVQLFKTKSSKNSVATAEQSLDAMDGISSEKIRSLFFDGELAEELVKDCKNGDSSIAKAIQYLDSGRRLLRSGNELKKANDGTGSKQMYRKAHTYAFIGRQLAEWYLLAYQTELSKTNNNASVDDGITAFENFLLSFLQCVGPCTGNDPIEMSRIQVEETLEVLNKLSKEESVAFKKLQPKEFNEKLEKTAKAKVRIAVAKVFNEDNTEAKDREKDKSDHDIRNFDVRRFVSELQSFYEADTTLDLPPIVLKSDEVEKRYGPCGSSHGDSTDSLLSDESLSYNYSESLKFDYGYSHPDRSVTTAGSTNHQEQEQQKQQQQQQQKSSKAAPSSRQVRKQKQKLMGQKKPKEESLEEGIYPGTTVVSISVRHRDFQKKTNQSSSSSSSNNNNSNNNKKKQSRRWRGRKQK